MIGIHCAARHGATPRSAEDSGASLCPACRELLEYAGLRLEKCPWGDAKPTCAKCPIHCYKPEMRARIREVMRYAGPRMLLRHPLMGLRHLADGLTRRPPRAT